MKPMTSTMIPAKKESDSNAPLKVFDYSHRVDRGSPHGDRGYIPDRIDERPPRERGPSLRDRNRDKEKDRDHRDSERDRDRDRSRKDNRDLRERDYDNRERDRDRDRDRENKRGRDWERDRHREDSDRDRDRDRDRYREDTDRDSKRFRWDSKADSERNSSKDRSSHSSSQKKESNEGMNIQEVSSHFKTPSSVFKNESLSESYLIEDLLFAPKRLTRPKQLVIILRGLPGSGKTYVAKLIKDKEIENGGSAPRILSLDDYFMVEKEVNDVDPDTGKKVRRKEFKFEYEIEMEEAYRSSLFKSFKKTIDDRFFPFIIVDAVHEKSKQYEQYWSYAKQRGFQVYIAEMDCKDPVICYKRNIHNRSLEEISKILESWEPKPRHFMSIDIRSLLQDVAIQEVEMEVESDKKDDDKDEESSNNTDGMSFHVPSRWEKLEATEEKLDQLGSPIFLTSLASIKLKKSCGIEIAENSTKQFSDFPA
ncbi:YLP motif-containing protein 1 [Argiope bruennichi]|nr:YLP motif-containing protein 1 [Argiope bruennichi]